MSDPQGLPGYDAWKLRSRDDDLDREEQRELAELANEERLERLADDPTRFDPQAYDDHSPEW